MPQRHRVTEAEQGDSRYAPCICASVANVIGLIIGLFLLSASPAIAQPKIGKSTGTGGKTSGPKVGKTSPKGQPEATEVPKTIFVQPSEGYLALSTTPAATVLLSGTGVKKSFQANGEGQLHISKLRPGSYRIEIRHADCEAHTETLKIGKGEPTVLIKPLIEKYGTLVLGLGADAAKDLAIKLDGRLLQPAELQIEADRIGIKRIPVGPHKIAISKPGFLDWSREKFDVRPGETPDNLLPVDLERATIALQIKSLPGARVYIDNEAKGTIANDGMLRVAGLLPGARKLRLELFGYENVERPLTLSLDRRELAEEIVLESIVESAEDKEDFDPSQGKWFPARPAGWEMTAGRGMSVRGESPALFKRASYAAGRFNIYDDFTMVFRARFLTGKGMAWIARARDARNYYRFELTTSRSALGGKWFVASLCREGTCTELSRDPVVVNIETPDDTITIKLEARGASLEHYIKAAADPRAEMQPLGRVISDEIFRKGGVGMCAVNGLESYVSNFLVIPIKMPRN